MLGSVIANTDVNYSYEMQYGQGKQITGMLSDNPDTLNYNYFENLLDVNVNYGNNIYLYAQLEYSEKPIYGKRRARLDSLFNSFYLEYSDNSLKQERDY